MAYKVFANGDTASADEINANFYAIFQGDRIPMTVTAGGTLTAAAGAGDIGSSSYVWNNLYCKNIYVNSLSVTTPYMFSLKAQVTCTTTTTLIQISGINGDALEIIKMDLYSVPNLLSSFRLSLNADSTSNYYNNGVVYGANSATAFSGATTSAAIGSGDIDIYSKTGKRRTVVFYGLYSGAAVRAGMVGSALWSNTTSTITSIEMYRPTAFDPGTTIKMWGIN
ncbi:MAG: hypothetical protein WC374_07540 [Phycisphaerae bacterium]|jgi:hypothetical protein